MWCTCIDKNIIDVHNFLLLPCHTLLPGRHDLPVAQLLPPEENRILRKIDHHFVKSLKQNIKRDPTGTGVPPLVVFCNQVTRAKYDPKLKDAYMYEVAGGLHSYTAKKELAEEYPHNPFYKKVEAVVYAGLSDEQALRLALRHNVNGHFVHKMTFRDLVSGHNHITLLVEHSML